MCPLLTTIEKTGETLKLTQLDGEPEADTAFVRSQLSQISAVSWMGAVGAWISMDNRLKQMGVPPAVRDQIIEAVDYHKHLALIISPDKDRKGLTYSDVTALL